MLSHGKSNNEERAERSDQYFNRNVSDLQFQYYQLSNY